MITTTLLPDLDDILAAKRYYLAERKRKTPLEAVRALASMQKRPLPFLSTVTSDESPLLVGQIRYPARDDDSGAVGYDPVGQALRFAHCAVDAIALFTDSTIYGGGLDDLAFVTRAVQTFRIPVITQDFIFDEYQIVEARAAGASAVMLSAMVLDADSLRTLVSATQRNRMTAIVSVASGEELETALRFSPTAIALSNYDFKNRRYDPDAAQRLRAQIPGHVRVMLSGGMKSPENVADALRVGLDALVVGEPLLSEGNLAPLRRLLNRPVTTG